MVLLCFVLMLYKRKKPSVSFFLNLFMRFPAGKPKSSVVLRPFLSTSGLLVATLPKPEMEL